MQEIITTISSLADQWLGANLLELFLLFLGILFCLLVLAAFWDKKIRFISAFSGLSLGLLLIVFLLWERFIHGFGQTDGWFYILIVGTTCCSVVLFSLRAISLARKDTIQYGTTLTAPAFIVLAVGSVLFTGMLAPNVMIGDEVTHYYMLETQVRKFPAPNFFAEIPNGWGGVETRRYPHSFFWHYLGAAVYAFTGGTFFFIQLYQALFLGQLLVAAYLLARTRRGVQTRSALIYLLLIASIPMTLIFSVVFYQDIPMAAQVVTAFYLLHQRRWLLATVFLCLGLGFKVTAILFFPAFFWCLLWWTARDNTILRTSSVVLCSLLIVGFFTYGFGSLVHRYSHLPFYPVYKAEQLIDQISSSFRKTSPASPVDHLEKQDAQKNMAVTEPMAKIIANHPGDLRIKRNFIVYGGILIYLAAGCAFLLRIYHFTGRRRHESTDESSLWLWGVGLSYMALVAYFLRSAPDARFFLPGLIFLLLPVAERLACLPKQRWIVIVAAVLALMQSGYALAKTYSLRTISPEIQEAISYLRQNPPDPRTVFMYPEGSYRFFPVPHEWYLNYRLREFWRADNDARLDLLKRHDVGAIVLKKNLISAVDESITDLGVYPDYFVRDIRIDDRFRKVFENNEIIIYDITP